MAEPREEVDRPEAKTEGRAFRWHTLFQNSAEALFLINRQGRLFFVSRAWEELTGWPALEARGLVCRRHKEPDAGSPEEMANAILPPPESVAGKAARARRLVPVRGGPARWCDFEFFPIRDVDDRLTILGKIAAMPAVASTEIIALPPELIALREANAQRFQIEHLTARSDTAGPLRRVVEQARLAAQTRAPILIVGEPGTGKHWLARAIHYQSTAREKTFAALDCSRLPGAAVAALLFGGGGLAWQATAGTLYLHEPARLPRDVQSRLISLAGEGGAKGPRLIAGYPPDSSASDSTRGPRDDLFCALGTLALELPPLRDRPAADLPWLVDRLLQRLALPEARGIPSLTAEAWELIYAYRWPGNIRELYRVLATALAHVGEQPAPGRIDVADLPAYLRLAGSPGAAPFRSLPLDKLLEQVERRLIVLAVRMAHGNKTRAAEILSIWRPRLQRRMEALGIVENDK